MNNDGYSYATSFPDAVLGACDLDLCDNCCVVS